MGKTKKPSYEDLANAFAEYLAATNNDGDPRTPDDEDLDRAAAVVAAAGGHY